MPCQFRKRSRPAWLKPKPKQGDMDGIMSGIRKVREDAVQKPVEYPLAETIVDDYLERRREQP